MFFPPFRRPAGVKAPCGGPSSGAPTLPPTGAGSSQPSQCPPCSMSGRSMTRNPSAARWRRLDARVPSLSPCPLPTCTSWRASSPPSPCASSHDWRKAPGSPLSLQPANSCAWRKGRKPPFPLKGTQAPRFPHGWTNANVCHLLLTCRHLQSTVWGMRPAMLHIHNPGTFHMARARGVAVRAAGGWVSSARAAKQILPKNLVPFLGTTI